MYQVDFMSKGRKFEFSLQNNHLKCFGFRSKKSIVLKSETSRLQKTLKMKIFLFFIIIFMIGNY